ncbi:hypothetical protein CYY_007172 [Polysphondylium violaceum]|uniref:Carbohydrate binding domain-containing protein n=1 Tax=Polysphondylium violaceum TaxID=133409 RepID=A0A8J4PR63_9MYCE|nr:hypothetical protein CYY_007172 [Polysphondylium violaceum]
MKLILVLCALLFSAAIASASYPYACGPYSCKTGEVCRTIDNVCHCIPIPQCYDVTLSQKVIGTWVDGRDGKTYTQYDVTITNHMNRNIKNLIIDTDYTLRLRDNSSIWNVNRLANNDLTLPSYQPSINAHASFTFGFILQGTQPAHLAIKAVVY